MAPRKKILVYGFGNPGRQDDGLGPAFATIVEEWKQKNKLSYITTDSNYQLNIEDALLISEYDIVIFADATVETQADTYLFEELNPAIALVKYTFHAASPAYVLKLCQEMFNVFPDARIMKIRGYEWNMNEGLTKQAEGNLKKAFTFFKDYCRKEIEG